jgi:predicted nuclease of predicted toxin-antitoxin system
VKLREIPLLLDQNLHPEALAWLRQQGADVLGASELELGEASDETLLRAATERGRAVLTHDRDFGALAFVMSVPMVGVALLRPGMDGARVVGALSALYGMDLDVEPPFFLVATAAPDGLHVRVRSR